MGEAKRRKQSDRFYGKEPKTGKGLVISNPVILKPDGSIRIKTTQLDPQELRHSLLFFEQLAWPRNSYIEIGSSGDASFLETAGILQRPHISVSSNNGLDAFKLSAPSLLIALNHDEPGKWSLGEGENSVFDYSGTEFDSEGGTFFQIVNAIPVPDKDVPLNEILEFRVKRRDELLSLRLELQDTLAKIKSAGDHQAAVQASIITIEKACLDVLKVSKESQFPLRMSDLKISYSLDLSKLGGAVFAGLLTAPVLSAPLSAAATAVLGAATGAVSLSFGGEISWKKETLSTNPFRYVAHVHNELFNI